MFWTFFNPLPFPPPGVYHIFNLFEFLRSFRILITSTWIDFFKVSEMEGVEGAELFNVTFSVFPNF